MRWLTLLILLMTGLMDLFQRRPVWAGASAPPARASQRPRAEASLRALAVSVASRRTGRPAEPGIRPAARDARVPAGWRFPAATQRTGGPVSADSRRRVTTLPPLRLMTRVRWPRSSPSCSMSAPVASDTRSPSCAQRPALAAVGGCQARHTSERALPSGRPSLTRWTVSPPSRHCGRTSPSRPNTCADQPPWVPPLISAAGPLPDNQAGLRAVIRRARKRQCRGSASSPTLQDFRG